MLETHELLAILLRTGSKDLNVLQLAVVVLNTFEDLHSLKMASLDELMHINGIGRTKAIELKAAMELGVRLSNAAQMKLGKITSSKMAGQWIVQELKDAYQEHLVALYLNTKKRDYQEENDLHRWVEQCSGASQRNFPGGSAVFGGARHHWP